MVLSKTWKPFWLPFSKVENFEIRVWNYKCLHEDVAFQCKNRVRIPFKKIVLFQQLSTVTEAFTTSHLFSHGTYMIRFESTTSSNISCTSFICFSRKLLCFPTADLTRLKGWKEKQNVILVDGHFILCCTDRVIFSILSQNTSKDFDTLILTRSKNQANWQKFCQKSVSYRVHFSTSIWTSTSVVKVSALSPVLIQSNRLFLSTSRN